MGLYQGILQQRQELDPKNGTEVKKVHLELPQSSPMRVCLAAQTMSHPVSRGILTHVVLRSIELPAAHTAGFVEKLDSLFDFLIRQSCMMQSPTSLASMTHRHTGNYGTKWKPRSAKCAL